MNTSTIEARGGATKRFGVLLLGLAVALAGTLALSGSRAEAVEKTITFDKGSVNLGFAFNNAPILPAEPGLPGAVSDPAFDPDLAIDCDPGTVEEPNPDYNCPTEEGIGTPLFNLDEVDPADFTRPGVPATQPVNSFTPLACATPVTLGIYFAVPYGEVASPDTIIYNPGDTTFGRLLGQPLANSGQDYYRVLPEASFLQETLAAGEQVPAAGESLDTLAVQSTAAFPDTGALTVGGTEVSYTGKTGTTFTGITGFAADESVADDEAVGETVTFANPFAGVPGQNPTRTLVGPYPDADTLWEPYAASGGNVTAPAGIYPQGVGGTTPFTGAAGLNLTPNPLENAPCPNPANGEAVVDLNEADGTFTGDGADFKMPIMIVPNPLDGSPVPITLDAPEGIEGTIDSATGEVRIDGPMQVRVLVELAGNQPVSQYCALDLPGREPGGLNNSTPIPDNGFALTTTYALPTAQGYAGTPFSSEDGLEGDGALVGTWNQTEDSVAVGGLDPEECDTVNGVSKGFGGIWLSSNVDEPADFPTCGDLGLVGTFAACTAPRPPAARMGNLTIKGPKAVKRGKVGTFRVTVRNSGTATMTGVRLRVAGRGVAFNTSVASIAAGKSRTVRVRAKFKRPGKVKATFTATASGGLKKVARKTVTVRK